MIIVAVLATVALIAPDPGEPPPIPTPTPVTQTITPPLLPRATPAPLTACASIQVVTVADSELAGVTQAGIDLLTEALGCVPFVLGEGGVSVAFHDFAKSWYSLRLLSTVAGYADGHWEVWVNPVCWSLVSDWAETLAHELGHMLGWGDMDGHPYMTWPAPPGARVGPGSIIEC